VYHRIRDGHVRSVLTCGFLSGLADGSYQFRAVVTDNAGNFSNTAAIAVIVDNTAPTAGTLTFAGLTDSGHTDTPTPITTDGTFRSDERRVGNDSGARTAVYTQ